MSYTCEHIFEKRVRRSTLLSPNINSILSYHYRCSEEDNVYVSSKPFEVAYAGDMIPILQNTFCSETPTDMNLYGYAVEVRYTNLSIDRYIQFS